jgi:hypothetical protein
MRLGTIRLLLALLAVLAGLGFALPASAHKMDLDPSGFIECNASGSVCYPMVSEWETFLAEYSFGLAPKLLAPAETLGYSGFYIGLEAGMAMRPNTKGAQERWDRATATDGYEDVMFVPTIHIRKGLPWSFEVGGTLSYLARSELVAIGAEVKWSLFEGYRHKFRGAMPDVAARGSVSRVVGSPDVDMTTVGVDGSISYPFGIGGMVSLTPYMGYQYLWSIARAEPLIKYQGGQYHPEQNGNWKTTGLTGPNLGRHKLFWGLRFGYEVLVITLEIDWGIKTSWKTDPVDNAYDDALAAGVVDQNYVDDEGRAEVGHQVQVLLGVGMDF